MPLFSLPDVCFINILSFLESHTLYNCLFVERYWCVHSVPILWRDPFGYTFKVINTLLACLNEDEISSLIPCAINFNNQPPLFEYGKFVRKINHSNCVEKVMVWLNSFGKDCRVQKLVNVIYHMIMRQGSNLWEIELVNSPEYIIDLPKFSIFTTFKPGIINLRSLSIGHTKNKNTIEFLSMVSKFCNGIIYCSLCSDRSNDHGVLVKSILDIIKSQPLEIISLYNDDVYDSVQTIIYALEFRSETLKDLSFDYMDFQQIDLSFLSKLERLERLNFNHCIRFASKHHEALSKRKFHLKELKLLYDEEDLEVNVVEAMINSLCSKTLLKLSLNVVTLETVKAVKESCPNINFLHIYVYSDQPLDQIIPLICEMSRLKFLNIEADFGVDIGTLTESLGDHLTSVEYLLFRFFIDLPSIKYFTNNCKANLKEWCVYVDTSLRRDFLKYVSNFQNVHNSLKVLGINGKIGINKYTNKFRWEGEELEVIDLLKNQGVEIVSSSEFFNKFDSLY